MQSSLSERLLCSALRCLRKSMNVIEALPTLRQRYRHPKPRTKSSSGSLSRPFGSVCWTSKNGKCNTFSGVVRIGSWKFYFSKVAASELQSGCQGTATCADGRCQAVPCLCHEPLHHFECYSNDGQFSPPKLQNAGPQMIQVWPTVVYDPSRYMVLSGANEKWATRGFISFLKDRWLQPDFTQDSDIKYMIWR